MFHRSLIVATLISLALVGLPISKPAVAKDPVYTGIFSSLAVSGYDPVAYFTEGKPVEGRSDFEYEWNSATWRFVDQNNLDAFKANPEAYAPQYGGYCAWAVAQGSTASSDPDAWRIVDGKLYLNYSKSVQEKWLQDISGNIAKADKNWPAVLEK